MGGAGEGIQGEGGEGAAGGLRFGTRLAVLTGIGGRARRPAPRRGRLRKASTPPPRAHPARHPDMSASLFMRGPALDLLALLATSVGALVLLPSVVQDEAPARAAAARPAVQDTTRGAGQDGAATAESTPLSLPLTGLTDENVDQAVSAVRALADHHYACPTCGEAGSEAGTCCDTERTPVKRRVLQSVQADTTGNRLLLLPRPGMWLRLGELRAALEPAGVAVDVRQLELTAPVRLLVEGLSSPEQLDELESALKESQQFGRVAVEPRPSELGLKAFVYVTPGASPVRYDAVTKLVRGLEGLRVIDLAWTDGAWTGEPRA